MPSAEIITIGTEILLGEITDTNSRYIARSLRDAGIDLYRKTSVGDNEERISQAIKQSLERCEIIITTGGLGPTIDDPTRSAVASSLNLDLVFIEELWTQIQERFSRFHRTPSDNNRKQAYIPSGAISIENPVGTAPAFIVENGEKCIISLPGVPREMEYLMSNAVIPFIEQKYGYQGVIKARILHTAGMGESIIDNLISDLELMTNPTVGLGAHAGQVDIRITAKAESAGQADSLIRGVEIEIRKRLGIAIYGADEESLESVLNKLLRDQNRQLVVYLPGAFDTLVERFDIISSKIQALILKNSEGVELSIENMTKQYKDNTTGEIAVILSKEISGSASNFQLEVMIDEHSSSELIRWGGPPEYEETWVINQTLNKVRELLI